MTETKKRSPITRLLSAVTALGSAVCMLPSMPNLKAEAAADATAYDLYISGTRVTSSNANNILGDGKFSFDAETKTLTLNGNFQGDSYADFLENKIHGLTVYVASDSVICPYNNSSYSANGIYSYNSDITITGPGKLTIEASDRSSAIMLRNSNLTIQDAYLEISGYNAIDGWTYDSTNIINSVVYAVGDTCAISYGSSGNFTMQNCRFVTPEGAHASRGKIVNADGTAASEVLIMPSDNQFDLKIFGTKVTYENANDILGNGIFSYNPLTKTLNVNGDYTPASNNVHNFINNNTDGLTVYVASDSRIVSGSTGIYTPEHEMTITGPGKLTISVDYGSYGIVSNDLTIKDADLETNNGIRGSSVNACSLNIINSAVNVKTPDISCIGQYKNGIYLDKCYITNKDVYINNGWLYYTNRNNNVTTLKIVPGDITFYDLWICGAQVNEYNADDILSDGTVSYDATANILTLNQNAQSINATKNPVLKNEIPDLTVNVTSPTTIISYNSEAIYLGADTTFTGNNKLSVQTNSGNSIAYAAIRTAGANLTIKDTNISVRGNQGIVGESGGHDKLILIGSDANISGSEKAVYDFNGGIILTGCRIASPEGVQISEDGSCIVNADGTDANSVSIQEKKYNLWVGDNQVKGKNAADILGDGTASYDETTNTLTLNGANITENVNRYALKNEIRNLTIMVAGDSTLLASTNCAAILDADTTITGSGKLTAESTASGYPAISISKGTNLTLKNANVRAIGDGAINGRNTSDTLTIINSDVELTGNTAAVKLLSGITLTGCTIVSPNGGKIGNNSVAEFVDADGNTAAYVKINPAATPEITKQPENASGCIGDQVQFTVEATGDNLIYQWQYYNTETKKWENTGLAGNKTPKLTVSVLANRNGMKYHCIVKDASGTKLTSNAATLKVNPKIATQPVDASGCVGDKVQFTVEATGIGLIYQWQYYNTETKKWENTGLAGNKTPTLTVSVLANRNGMKYHCIVKDASGTKLTSSAVTLKVNPKITAQPVDAEGCIGDKVQFTVEAAGAGLIYQWQYYNAETKKWENTGLAGNKTPTLTVTVTSARNGMKYHCIVKDANGTKLTSAAVTLKVLPKIVTQPQSVSAAAGSTAKFTVEATGIGLVYQWQYYNTSTKKWENTGLTGNKTATLSVTAISSRNGMKYHCIIKDSAGNKLTSTAATLTVK